MCWGQYIVEKIGCKHLTVWQMVRVQWRALTVPVALLQKETADVPPCCLQCSPPSFASPLLALRCQHSPCATAGNKKSTVCQALSATAVFAVHELTTIL